MVMNIVDALHFFFATESFCCAALRFTEIVLTDQFACKIIFDGSTIFPGKLVNDKLNNNNVPSKVNGFTYL